MAASKDQEKRRATRAHVASSSVRLHSRRKTRRADVTAIVVVVTTVLVIVLPAFRASGGRNAPVRKQEGCASGSLAVGDDRSFRRETSGAKDDTCRIRGKCCCGGGDSSESDGQSPEKPKQERKRFVADRRTLNQTARARSIEKRIGAGGGRKRVPLGAERRRARPKRHPLAPMGERQDKDCQSSCQTRAASSDLKGRTGGSTNNTGRRLEGSPSLGRLVGAGARTNPKPNEAVQAAESRVRVEPTRTPSATDANKTTERAPTKVEFRLIKPSSRRSQSPAEWPKLAEFSVNREARGEVGSVVGGVGSGDIEGAVGRQASRAELRLAGFTSSVESSSLSSSAPLSSSPSTLLFSAVVTRREASAREKREEGGGGGGELLQSLIGGPSERSSEKQTKSERTRRELLSPKSSDNNYSNNKIDFTLVASNSFPLELSRQRLEQAQIVRTPRRAQQPQAGRSVAPEKTNEQLVQLLAEFYAHTVAVQDKFDQYLYLQRFRPDGDVESENQDQQRPPEVKEESSRAEVAAQKELIKSSKRADKKLARIKMKMGADEESLLKWLRQRQERFSSLKNATFELLTEYPNRTINVCSDGPKILVLPNVSDILYCYTRDQWIDKLWSDLHLSPFHYPIIVLNMLIFLFGTTGNIFVCLSVYRNHQLRDVTNYFIVNLAFADFLVILICLPATVVWDLSLTWFFGTIPCKLIMFLQDVSISVSVLTLTAISIDRYYAICHPLRFKSNLSQAKRIIAIIWLVSLLLMAPDLVYLSAKESQDLSEAGLETVLYSDCNYNWSEKASRVFQFVKTILLYLLPFMLMFCAHFKIMRTLQVASASSAPAYSAAGDQPPPLLPPAQFSTSSGADPARSPSNIERPSKTNSSHQEMATTNGRGNNDGRRLGQRQLNAGGVLQLISANNGRTHLAASSLSVAGVAPSVKSPPDSRIDSGDLARIGRCHSELSGLGASRLQFATVGSTATAATSVSIDSYCSDSPNQQQPAQKQRGRHRKWLRQHHLRRPGSSQTQSLELNSRLGTTRAANLVVAKSASPSAEQLQVGGSERRLAPSAHVLAAHNSKQRVAPSSQQKLQQLGANNSLGTFASCSSVNSSQQQQQLMVTMHNKNKLESRRKVAKMLMAIVALFGLCYLPVHLINFLRQFIEDIPQTDVTSTISMLAHCFCYLNSAINPIIYNHMNSVFRAEFRRFLSGCFSWSSCTQDSKEAGSAECHHFQQQRAGRSGQQRQSGNKLQQQQNRLLRLQGSRASVTSPLAASTHTGGANRAIHSGNNNTSLVIITDCSDSLADGCLTPPADDKSPSRVAGEEGVSKEEGAGSSNLAVVCCVETSKVASDNTFESDRSNFDNNNNNNTLFSFVAGNSADSDDDEDSGGLARSQLGSIVISFATIPNPPATTLQQQTTPV